MPVPPVPVVDERPTKPVSWLRPTNPPRSIGWNSPDVPVLVPDVRLDDEDVVREELTELLEVADVRFACAQASADTNKQSNPPTRNARVMAQSSNNLEFHQYAGRQSFVQHSTFKTLVNYTGSKRVTNRFATILLCHYKL